ncbi:tetratricopeptide repeat protein [Streptomyces sp. CBMA152]|uniref:tetratricopeptide repeat protein n=1 Tax=Streptomyces sp. CBMA152 TaxID=1896312 RepID=UPI001660875B|nr:tetratricopeptide repeat protein [Streptomyces sp. CBMA152]MBD0747772.1 regulator [Streptomyces sp. CBMA152]
MLETLSVSAVTAVLGAVGSGMANEAGKRAWESAGGLVRRVAGREVPAPRDPAELEAVARLVREGARRDPDLARAWSAFARTAPTPGLALGVPQLPASTRFFTDRKEALKALDKEADRKADGRPRLVLLYGPEGIGTSALALHWGCREAARFPDGQLHLDLRGGSAAGALDAATALRLLLDRLGMAREEIPPGADGRADALRRTVAGRRLLIVLDHAHSAAQIRPLLTSAPGVFTVVVSRRPLAGLDAVPVAVGPLTDKDAVRLLTQVAGKQAVAEAKAALPGVLRRCAGSPYALRAAAPRLLDTSAAPSPDDPVRTAVEDTYRTLEPATARAYRLLALRAWPAIGPDAAAATLDVPRDEAAVQLAELVESRLLEQDGERCRYRPGVRAHAEAAAVHEDGIAACSAALRRAVAWYADFAVRASLAALSQSWRIGARAGALRAGDYRDAGEALDALRAELGNLLEAVYAAEEFGDTDAVCELNEALWPLQLKMGCHDELLPALRAGVRAADARDPDSRAAGRMHTLLGLDLTELGRWDEAEAEFLAAAEAERRAGHVRGRATAVESLGLLRLRQWRFEEAYERFEEADALLAGIGPDDEGAADLPRARALLERHRGRALRGQGRRPEAIARLELALRFFRETAEPYNTARTLTDLAETHLDGDDAVAALPLIDEAIAALEKDRAAYHLARLRALRERCVSAAP